MAPLPSSSSSSVTQRTGARRAGKQQCRLYPLHCILVGLMARARCARQCPCALWAVRTATAHRAAAAACSRRRADCLDLCVYIYHTSNRRANFGAFLEVWDWAVQICNSSECSGIWMSLMSSDIAQLVMRPSNRRNKALECFPHLFGQIKQKIFSTLLYWGALLVLGFHPDAMMVAEEGEEGGGIEV